MKTLLKILGALAGIVLVAGIGFFAWVQLKGIPHYQGLPQPTLAVSSTPDRVELGEKLVMSTCADCHLNRGTGTLSGQKLRDIPADFGAVFSANITQDVRHGIGGWTDGQVVQLLRTGVGPDGRYRLVMPSFVHMSDEDMSSIVAFLRSNNPLVRPTAAVTPAQQPSFLLKALANTVMKPTPMPAAAVVAPATSDALAYGRYLVVGRYKCYDCHSADFKTNNALQPEKSEGYLGGGTPMLNLDGQEVVSRNITADAATGIGNWTEAQFAQSIRFGMSPDGPLKYPMPKYSRLGDEEVHALFAYLQSVPRLKNATPEDAPSLAAR